MQPTASGKLVEIGAINPDIQQAVSDVSVNELAMFIHNIALIASDGTGVPLQLDTSNPYQGNGHVLLDFSRDELAENPEDTYHTIITGTVPKQPYDGVRFTIGVHPDHNHLNADIAPSPLNTTWMFWTWAAGYKYIRADLSVGDAGKYPFHLGAIGCNAPDGTPGEAVCDSPNTVEIVLENFQPKTDAIAWNLDKLFANVALDGASGDTKPGCMSGPKDVGCAQIFSNLGLTHPTQDGESPDEQVFSVIKTGE